MDCAENISVDDIIEKCTPEDFQRPLNEPCEDLLAYCHYCDHPNPSVVELSNGWVCLVCLEPHFEPGHCDWCNEFITGDLEGSGYFGCSHCDGKRGWAPSMLTASHACMSTEANKIEDEPTGFKKEAIASIREISFPQW